MVKHFKAGVTMGTFLRIYDPNYTHFIGNRCEHEMFFMVPKKELNKIILDWLTKAKVRWGNAIDIYGFIFLSNHFHLILKDPRGQLAKFMCYFQANVAKAVNRLLGRNGKFWSREYDDVIVDGENEFLDRLSYILCNAVKSGLVATPAQWSGVSSYEYMMENKSVSSTVLDLTRYNDARRHDRKADKKDFETEFSFELAVPPMLADKKPKERVAFIKELMKSAMSKYRKERLYKPALGMKKVKAQSPFDRPKKPKKRPRFKFMSFCAVRRKELQKDYENYVAQYKRAIHALFVYCEDRRNIGFVDIRVNFNWPMGSYPPSTHWPAGVV